MFLTGKKYVTESNAPHKAKIHPGFFFVRPGYFCYETRVFHIRIPGYFFQKTRVFLMSSTV